MAAVRLHELGGKNDCVVVSLNHRVGVLGFLDVSHLGEGVAESGNLGMLDIVAALEWVRTNIPAFGGDPSKVTIFGESGGGSKVTCLLGMPAARGLFRRAFAMSGALLRARDADFARATTDRVLDEIRVAGDLDSLRELEWPALVDAEAAIFRAEASLSGRRPRGGFGPTLGPSLPRHPVDSVRAGCADGVEVVIGCTTHEGLLALTSPEIWTGGVEAIEREVARLAGENADQLWATYRRRHPEESRSRCSSCWRRTSSCACRTSGSRRPWRRAARRRGCTSTTSGSRWCQGSVLWRVTGGHAVLFDNVHLAPSAQVDGADALAAQMSGALVALARTGDPNHPGLPAWPTYAVPERSTMVFDVEPRVDRDSMSAERQAWDAVDVGIGLG